MKVSASLGSYPAGRPLNSDQVLEYHAARVLLLVRICGAKNAIWGLTKLAKLDFFVRYPSFFDRAAVALGKDPTVFCSPAVTESVMVRHHYGPWDPRYYQVLAFLEGRELLKVDTAGRAFVFALTRSGAEIADLMASDEAFADLTQQMGKVKALFGAKTGNWLKKLIYQVFEEEVAQLARGEVIR